VTWLRVLGVVEIRAGEMPASGALDAATGTIAVTSPRLRRLLAALVVRAGTVASPGWLAEAVWEEAPPRNVEGALQTLVSRVRAMLREADAITSGPVVELVTAPAGYQLRLETGQLDAARFEELARQGHGVARSDPGLGVQTLDEALSWWGGPPYAELSEAEFARPDAVRLGQLHTDVTLDRLELLLRIGSGHDATATLEGLVTSQPLNERPISLLMLARHRDGRQQAALELYADFRHRLADELGLEPSPALQQLQTRILRQDPMLDLTPTPDGAGVNAPSIDLGRQRAPEPRASETAEHLPTTATTQVSGNLPAIRRRLVGREEDSAQLAEAIAPGAVVTVIGPGGVGKTSLARVVAERLMGDFVDGVWWCELAAVSEPDALPNALRTTLGAPPRQGASVTERLVDYLRARRSMLVLDNCEHVVGAAAAVVEEIHRECPDVAVLATSRMPLEVSDEQVRSLTPLATPRLGEFDVDAIEREPAVELFVKRATAQSPDFALTAETAEDVAEICRRLDGLPLALELAASRMRTMSPADLVDRLSWRFRLLHGGARAADDRHRTLRAVVDWSYELLEPEERRVFDALSVFAGAFDLDDAEELVERLQRVRPGLLSDRAGGATGMTSGLVLDLVDRSMVTVTRGSDRRYHLLETIRAYGREKLAESGDADTVARVHAELFANLAEGAAAHLFGPLHIELAGELASHIDELRAAFTWAVDSDLGLSARLIGGMPPYVESRISAEVAHWALRTIEIAEEHGRRPPGLARVYAVAASGARFAGALDEAHRLIDQGLALASDDLTKAYLVYLASEVALFEGRFDEAWERLAQLRRFDDAADVAGFRDFGEVLASLLLAYAGEHEEAAAVADRCRSEGERTANPVLTAWATYTQGEVRLDVDPIPATRYLDEALVLARRSGDRYLTGVALVSAASVRSRHGDPEEAIALFRDVVLHWYSSGNWLHQWTTLRNLVDLLVRLERDEDAAVLIGAIESRSTIERFGDEARRFDAATRTLADRLDPGRMESLVTDGAAMRDDEVVAFVLTSLAGVEPS
jgi:predicted ATPase/DNA-binding SARP family transcriptional activator